MSLRIPVYAGEHLVEYADEMRAGRLMQGSNVTATRVRKTGAIARLTIRAVSELQDGREHGGNDQALTYRETLGGHAVVILKRYEAETGRYVQWSDEDSFDPRRFNPDRVPPALRSR